MTFPSDANTSDVLTIVGLVVGVFTACLASVWSLSWWLSNQFTALRNLLYTTVKKSEENIIAKLEYHEKHDDQRFSSVDERFSSLKDDLWEIRVRNAALDNTILKSHREKLKEVMN